ncbi:MAG: hypothetical protein QM751_05465 [Paludibacteraceae bacterium]
MLSIKKNTNFDFIIGHWTRTNEEVGKQTFENWDKINDSTYIEHSYTLVENDTVWQENTILSPINGVWYYQVKTSSNTVSTDFKMINHQRNVFTCENRDN